MVKEKYGEEIKELFGKEVIVPTTPFPVIKLADLYDELEKEFGYTVPDSEKGDLTTDAERLSYDWVMKKYGHEFLFITATAPRSVRSTTCATRTACPRATT